MHFLFIGITALIHTASISYWEEAFLEQDYIVVGAGIVGLGTAIGLKERSPDAKVLVVERGSLPTGASTRNAGFACIGSVTEVLMDAKTMGIDVAVAQLRARLEGLHLLRSTFGDAAIGFVQTGNYELLEHLEDLESINTLIGEEVFIQADELLPTFGFRAKHMVLNRLEGLLDTGKLMTTLEQRALSLGVTIRYGSQAERPIKSAHELILPVNGIPFRAKGIAICTNAFISELLPEIPIQPGRAQVLVTEPLKSPLRFNAPVHMERGFYFFRPLPDNRILIGGGRHLDFAGETTTSLTTTPHIIEPLRQLLSSTVVPGETPSIAYEWAGVMGFSPNHLPLIQEIPDLPGVVVGFGCNGMGVARGFQTGLQTASLLDAVVRKN